MKTSADALLVSRAWGGGDGGGTELSYRDLSIRFSAQGGVPSPKRAPDARLKRNQAESQCKSHWNSVETNNTEGTRVPVCPWVWFLDVIEEKGECVCLCTVFHTCIPRVGWGQ